MLRDKDILLISPEPWDHIFVSKHHYAVHLARRGNRVYFLGPPSSRTSIQCTKFKNLFIVSYKGFSLGLRFYPTAMQRKTIAKVYNTLTTLCQTNFDIVWSFDNSVFFDFSALPARALKISHIVDYSQNFQMARAAFTADFSFCTSAVIRNRLVRYSSNVHKINHGYHVPGKSLAKPTKDVGRVRALYAGNLSIRYIDWHLLSVAIDNHPDVDFTFIGPVQRNSPQMKMLAGKRNVCFIGRVDSDELAAQYQMADVLLVAYKQQFQEDQATNPHKIMEYLGSGKVIVATKTAEYESLSPLIVMSQTNSAWLDLLREVIVNLQHYNSTELCHRRMSIAMQNTYDKQIDTIEKIISRR